jgi:hypothetical protein
VFWWGSLIRYGVYKSGNEHQPTQQIYCTYFVPCVGPAVRLFYARLALPTRSPATTLQAPHSACNSALLLYCLTSLCAPSTSLLLSSSVFLRLHSSTLHFFLLVCLPLHLDPSTLLLYTSPPPYIRTASTSTSAINATLAFSTILPRLLLHRFFLSGRNIVLCLHTRIGRNSCHRWF